LPIACSTLPRAGTEFFARWAGCETRGSWAEQSEETGMTSWGTEVRARPALPFSGDNQGIFATIASGYSESSVATQARSRD
jgi:hypothetical protein